MPKLILMVGESGSGKTTKAKELLLEGQKAGCNIVRVNMDSIREMLFGKESSWDLRLRPDNLLCKRSLRWYEKVFKFAGINVQTEKYGIIYSSRRVIKNVDGNTKANIHFYDEDIWGIVAKRGSRCDS